MVIVQCLNNSHARIFEFMLNENVTPNLLLSLCSLFLKERERERERESTLFNVV